MEEDFSEDMIDVEEEEIEFSLNEEDIDEWINELTRLKEEKSSIELEIDEDTKLKINFDDSPAEEMEEEE